MCCPLLFSLNTPVGQGLLELFKILLYGGDNGLNRYFF
jgi:hypothetical protein